MDHADRTGWRQAVVYQVHTRSFADRDGDGISDIDGSPFPPAPSA